MDREGGKIGTDLVSWLAGGLPPVLQAGESIERSVRQWQRLEANRRAEQEAFSPT